MKLRRCCLACREYTGNVGSRKVTVTSKVTEGKSKFMREKPNKKVVSNIAKKTC